MHRVGREQPGNWAIGMMVVGCRSSPTEHAPVAWHTSFVAPLPPPRSIYFFGKKLQHTLGVSSRGTPEIAY